MAKTDDRLFAPWSIEMDEHPKIMCLSDAAFRALFEAVNYSRRMMSDGFLDERVVLRKWGVEVAAELTANDPERPSWVRVDGSKPGWRIHNFEEHHPLRADIEEKRAAISGKRSEAGRKGAAKRWQTGSKPVANDSSETETETETSSSTKKKPPASRGARLEPTWLPSAEDIAKIRSECPDIDPQREHVEFVDYWVGAPGQRGVKADWPATWRNWMRRRQRESVGRSKPSPTERATRTVMLATELLGVEQ